VVFTADHAETFWEHADYSDHGLFVYDSNVRIPLIVNWPGLVSAGAALSAEAGESERQRLIFAEACKPYDVEEGAPRLNFNKAKSVRQGLWKLVSVPFMQNRRELYDLSADPAETTNLIRNPAYRKTVTALSGELERWASDFAAGGPAGEMDEQTREKLEALGY